MVKGKDQRSGDMWQLETKSPGALSLLSSLDFHLRNCFCPTPGNLESSQSAPKLKS